jgi:hypothetical protein
MDLKWLGRERPEKQSEQEQKVLRKETTIVLSLKLREDMIKNERVLNQGYSVPSQCLETVLIITTTGR